MKRCPFCAEEIQDEAVVCKHCGRDLDGSTTRDTAARESVLQKTIQRYLSYGYNVVTQIENTAVMERRAPVNATTMIAAVLFMWPVAILYAIPGLRKKYSVQINADSKGRAIELGGTISEYEQDRKKAKTWGWVLLSIAIVLVLLVIIGSSS